MQGSPERQSWRRMSLGWELLRLNLKMNADLLKATAETIALRLNLKMNVDLLKATAETIAATAE